MSEREYSNHHKKKHHPKRTRKENLGQREKLLNQNVQILPNPDVLIEHKGSERIQNSLKKVGIGVMSAVSGIFAASYSIHHQEILSSYGKDFIGPLAFWYGAPQILGLVVPRFEKWSNSKKPLIYYSIYAIATECAQYQIRNIPTQSQGRFDPMDLLALGAGLAFATAVDRFISPKK